jgi:hypothetical protein
MDCRLIQKNAAHAHGEIRLNHHHFHTMKTAVLFRAVAIWLAFSVITLIYLFGVSAMHLVEFVSHESFGKVCGRVISAGTGPVDFSFHGWILAGAFAALVVHGFSKVSVRLGIALLCVIAPWFWTGCGIKGTAQWLFLMPYTPLWTIAALASGADGEFYAEGFMIALAVGWWMIMWTILGFVDFLKLRREQTKAVPDKPERLLSE